MAVNSAKIVHDLRFYIGDITQPYTHVDEELRVYVQSAAQRIGLDGAYATWDDIPTKFEGLLSRIAYLHWLLKRATSAVSLSDVKVEDFEVGTGEAERMMELLRETRRAVEQEMEELGAGMVIIDSSSITMFDRATHTTVPYERASEPTQPVLAIAVSGTTAEFFWTRYEDRDFRSYALQEKSGTEWLTRFLTHDNHKNSTELENLAAGDYIFRLKTTLNDTLFSASEEVPITVT